jgi:hypothetical protein
VALWCPTRRIQIEDRLQLARSCRLRQRKKLGSFLGHTDRGGDLLGGAAPDPERKWQPLAPIGFYRLNTYSTVAGGVTDGRAGVAPT